ncbi:hypothetical protein CSA56_01445 [candidate division KSB3 bacterium]|uniref:Glycosyltransferase RgtA/B/C/D-like domain-containing protein n=1 Tax=candidate division KSB3 bacterium TaxID=2044937 RepID=A0A2G6KKE4_9BACT|nr:MAG: hypothetical protein CSA56_01445 [candidate division KSB3 bacterium]
MNSSLHFVFSRKFLLLLFLVFLLTRVVHLTADPPQDLSWSLGLFFDEGVYNHNARNQILFGEWKLDEWNDYYYSAISTWIKYYVLGLIGVGRSQIRLISIAYSMLSLLFVYLAAKESYGKKTGLIALLLFGTNYVSTMYSRVGMQDTQTLTVFIIAFYFWQAGMRRLNEHGKLWSVYMFLAGVTVFISYTYKNLFLYLLPVPFVALFVSFLIHVRHPQRRIQIFKAFAALLLGTVSAFSLWYLTFYRPNQDIISQFGSFFTKQQMFPTTKLSKVLEIMQGNPLFAYLSHTPVVLFGAFFTLLALYVILFSEKRSALHDSDLYVMTWFWAVFLFTTIIAYRPMRYFLPILPPLCLLTARGLGRLNRPECLRPPRHLSVFFFPVAGLWLTIVFGFGLLPLRSRGIHSAPANTFISPTRFDTIGGLLASFLCLCVLWKFFTKKKWKIPVLPQRFFSVLALVLVLSSVICDGRWYYRWLRTLRFDVADTGRDLMTFIGDTPAYIGGMNAPGVAYDTPYKVLFSWDQFVNYRENPIEKYRLTHLFLGDGAGSDERRYYYRKYPRNMYRATPLRQYTIKNTVYTLFSLLEPRLEILLDRDQFHPNDKIEVPLRVINYDFREPRQFLLTWALYPLEETEIIEPWAKGERQELWMQAESYQEISIPGYIPDRAGKYSLLVSWQEPKVQIFQAEDAKSQIGRIVPDQAGGNTAVFHHGSLSSPEKGFIIYGDYRYFPAGAYEASFRIKVGENTSTEPILRLDAAGHYGKVTLPYLDVRGVDFPDVGQYHYILLPFLLKTGTSFVEFRVYTYGITDVWIDTIRLTAQEGVWREQPIEVRN